MTDEPSGGARRAPTERSLNEIQKEFFLESGIAFVNHGSYGALPRSVAAEQQLLLHQLEANPDKWFRRSFKPQWMDAIKSAACVVGANPEDLVFVKNATAGVNCVLNSLKIGAGDACLMTSQAYGACANAMSDMCERTGAELVTLELDRHALANDSAVEQALDDILARRGNICFAILDHITSPTAVTLPVRRLCDICHSHGVRVLIDGAHAPGNVRRNSPPPHRPQAERVLSVAHTVVSPLRQRDCR